MKIERVSFYIITLNECVRLYSYVRMYLHTYVFILTYIHTYVRKIKDTQTHTHFI